MASIIGDSPPLDRVRIVQVVFFLHGISALLPWNMLINADSYFVDYKLNPPLSVESVGNGTWNSTAGALVNYRQNFLPYLSTASKVPNIIFQLVNLLFSSSYKSYSRRMNFTFTIQIGLFLVLILLAFMDTSSWPEEFFWVTMAIAVLFNTVNGIFQSCVYGIGAKFPMAYINYITLGFSFSGVIASIFFIISLLMSPHPKEVAIVYFTFATVFMIMCYINELLISRNKFYRYYVIEEKEKKQDLNGTLTAYHNSVPDDNCNDSNRKENRVEQLNCVEASTGKANWSQLRGLKLYIFVFQKSWIQLLNTILLYVATFSIFPAVQAAIKPVDNYVDSKFFAPIFCFLFFNLFATAGNYVAEKYRRPKPTGVIYWVLARFLFIPIFLVCNYVPTSRRRVWPVLVHSDTLYALLSASMSFTNGYLSSLAMMYTPKCVPAPLASTAAMMASAAVIIGIVLGVQISIFLQQLVTESLI